MNMLPFVPFLLAVLVFMASAAETPAPSPQVAPSVPANGVRVAVVGAGVGGATFTAFLREELDKAGFGQIGEIVVFERGDHIGGRVRDTSAAEGYSSREHPVELGASMAIKQNRYMSHFAQATGLKRQFETSRPGRGSGKLAIVSDAVKAFKEQAADYWETEDTTRAEEEKVREEVLIERRRGNEKKPDRMPDPPFMLRNLGFLESDWSIVTLVKMLWRYGPLQFFRLRAQGSELIKAFDSIYGFQDAGVSVGSPAELLQRAGLHRWATSDCRSELRRVVLHPGGEDDGEAPSAGDPLVLSELVAGLMRNNYAQDWELANALVCMTAVAPLAAGGSAAAWSIEGGNAQVVQRLLEQTQAEVRTGVTVTGVAKGSGRAYAVQMEAAGGRHAREEFDFVVLATPLAAATIDLSGLADTPDRQRMMREASTAVQYQHVHTTLVSGTLRPAYFGLPDRYPLYKLINSLSDILTTRDSGTPFLSIGRYGGEAEEEGDPLQATWKLFSEQALSDADLKPVFKDFNARSVVRHAWTDPGAYPTSRAWYNQLDVSFVLHEEGGGMVLYPSAFEAATSAMEVLAVAARNAALLVKEKLVATASGDPRTTLAHEEL